MESTTRSSEQARNAGIRRISVEAASYQLGVRLTEARILAAPNGFFNPRRTQLLAALNRLRLAIIDWNDAIGGQVEGQFDHRISDCTAKAEALSGTCKEDDKARDEPLYEECTRQLNLVEVEISRLFARSSGLSGDARSWCQLGQSIARGESPVSGPPYRLDESGVPQPSPQERPGWQFDDPGRVDELTQELGISAADLVPKSGGRDAENELLPTCLIELADGWVGIEHGLQDLIASSTSIEVPGEDSQSDEAGIGWPNDERDRWIYEQCCSLVNYATTISDLKKMAPGNAWKIVSTIGGIKSAASRWAERNGKPPIPKRRRGRPRE